MQNINNITGRDVVDEDGNMCISVCKQNTSPRDEILKDIGYSFKISNKTSQTVT